MVATGKDVLVAEAIEAFRLRCRACPMGGGWLLERESQSSSGTGWRGGFEGFAWVWLAWAAAVEKVDEVRGGILGLGLGIGAVVADEEGTAIAACSFFFDDRRVRNIDRAFGGRWKVLQVDTTWGGVFQATLVLNSLGLGRSGDQSVTKCESEPQNTPAARIRTVSAMLSGKFADVGWMPGDAWDAWEAILIRRRISSRSRELRRSNRGTACVGHRCRREAGHRRRGRA